MDLTESGPYFGQARLDDSMNKDGGHRVPTVEVQLKVLIEKLDLTGDQQARIRPILQELHDATEKIVQDKSLAREERLAEVRPQRNLAGEVAHIRTFAERANHCSQ
jgi:hypothetical protein